MTIRELVLLLEKHDPEIPVLLMVADYDGGSWFDLCDIKESHGKPYSMYPKSNEWDVNCKESEPGVVKILLLNS